MAVGWKEVFSASAQSDFHSGSHSHYFAIVGPHNIKESSTSAAAAADGIYVVVVTVWAAWWWWLDRGRPSRAFFCGSTQSLNVDADDVYTTLLPCNQEADEILPWGVSGPLRQN